MTTPFVTSDNALRTEEFSLLEPGVLDNKCYVKGIGNVAERTVQGAATRWTSSPSRTRGRQAKGGAGWGPAPPGERPAGTRPPPRQAVNPASVLRQPLGLTQVALMSSHRRSRGCLHARNPGVR